MSCGWLTTYCGGKLSRWMCTDIELGVICVGMENEIMFTNNMTKGEHIGGKKYILSPRYLPVAQKQNNQV